MNFTKEDIEKLDRKYRINLINSISGIKPANLIGTRSNDGFDNLAIFSSVVHLGADPALMGCISRPQSPSLKDTYSNIKETGAYTINSVSSDFTKKAHYTSAKLDKTESEFERMNIQSEFIDHFPAPFVKNSRIKIGLKYHSDIVLPNDCLLIIGEIVFLSIDENDINELGQIDFEQIDGTGISGLNSYYELKKIDTYPYVRSNEIPDFDE